MAPPQNTKVNAKSKTFPEVKESKIPSSPVTLVLRLRLESKIMEARQMLP
ncbi:MAG: hypothetical protein MK510_00565 [SAR324 cluster bacterium]|nr:hypothetical protein [SAR324 cluster bacterium]